MKLNSISLKFSDVDEENAKMEIVTDPEDIDDTDIAISEQPCFYLAWQCVRHLQQQKQASEEENGIEVGDEEEEDSDGSTGLQRTIH